jgi:N-acetylmuramoyl-L-alanine amidase
MRLLTRAEWGATYDVNQRPPMVLPVAHAFLHHSVTVPSNDPAGDMRHIEQIDIGRFGYPSYSWVIHPTGVVLEGMGTHIGAHTINNNSTSFGVCLIGNYENDTPTQPALDACVTLLAARIAQGHLTSDFQLFGHRDVYATACPGANLYPLIGQIRSNVNTPPEEDVTPEQDQKLTQARDSATWIAGSDPNTGQPTGRGVPHIETLVEALAARVEQIAKKVGA